MITQFKQRILLEFDNVEEFSAYLSRYLEKGYTLLILTEYDDVNKKYKFEIEKQIV